MCGTSKTGPSSLDLKIIYVTVINMFQGEKTPTDDGANLGRRLRASARDSRHGHAANQAGGLMTVASAEAVSYIVAYAEREPIDEIVGVAQADG